ncbi:MAG TPA: hypothetical protein VMS99_08355 [Acidimicrobiia bacterium]|nr:hypothetical protein [Acidimicrobiia bacterium]
MARIDPVTREEATPEQRRVGDIIFGSRNEDYGGPSAVLLLIPDLAERFDHLRDYLVRRQRLPEPMVHLAALMAARFWAAEYAWWKRVPMCLRAEIPPDAIDAILEGSRPQFGDAGLEAVYDYLTELLEHRRVSDPVHHRLQRLIGEECLIELVVVVGFYSMLGLVCDAFEPDFPPGVAAPRLI